MFATNDSNESKNSLASGRILNYLNNSLQEDLLLVAAIILLILFLCTIFVCWIPPDIIPYDIME
jgi:hypothetical protein